MKILLVDNGSLEPRAVFALRAVARALAQKVGAEVFPVSLAYADKIAPSDLGGVPAQVVESFLRAALATGGREFVILPFFVGPSRAVTRALPRLVEKLRAELPAPAAAEFAVRLAPVLHQPGDTTLAQIVAERVRAAIREHQAATRAGAGAASSKTRFRVALVDHGSPTRAVTQVRDEVAAQLAQLLSGEVAEVVACSMERRPGAEYDFNEPLLEAVLARQEWRAYGQTEEGATSAAGVTEARASITAEATATTTADSAAPQCGPQLVRSAGESTNGGSAAERLTIVAPLFLLPGRHAGLGGDIAQICTCARLAAAYLHTLQTEPLGAHPLLVDLLAKHLATALSLPAV